MHSLHVRCKMKSENLEMIIMKIYQSESMLIFAALPKTWNVSDMIAITDGKAGLFWMTL